MRSNPKYQNICRIRFGRYQYKKCVGCSKEGDCNIYYNKKTGEWMYPQQMIPKPECAPSKVTFHPKKDGYYDTWMKGIY